MNPHIIIDDGCDMIKYYHDLIPDSKLDSLIGCCEETTTGVERLRAMESAKVLRYPVVAVNDSRTKCLFDNVYGTGQSTLDGIIRATNRMIAGSTFVVVGYGNCGKGVAQRARGLGAHVIVTEVDPIKALQAHMDGFTVMKMADAACIGDFFVTVTGNINVIDTYHVSSMKDGAILCNSGHFDVEINMKGLEKISTRREINCDLTEYTLNFSGKRIVVISEGRLVNLCAANGHPSCVLDLSFSGQAYAVQWLLDNHGFLEPRVYLLPDEIDRMISQDKLDAIGVKIDKLTEEQIQYLRSWQSGT